MKRKDYDNFKWYPIIDEGEYFVEEFPDEFPDCVTLVQDPEGFVYTQNTIYLGWGTMAKYEGWKFMIIPLKQI